MWYDDYYDDVVGHWDDDDEDKSFGQYDAYKKRCAQKTLIKDGVLPISWHPSRYWYWCMSEDENSNAERLWR